MLLLLDWRDEKKRPFVSLCFFQAVGEMVYRGSKTE